MTLETAERNDAGFRRARFRAIAMLGSKLIVYCACLELTLIGSVWFVKEWNCLNKLDAGYSVEITIAIWLFDSIAYFLIYAVKILTFQIFDGVPREMIEGNNDRRVLVNQVREQQARSLTETEINAMVKLKLTSYAQLSWHAKASFNPSGNISIEMTNFAND